MNRTHTALLALLLGLASMAPLGAQIRPWGQVGAKWWYDHWASFEHHESPSYVGSYSYEAVDTITLDGKLAIHLQYRDIVGRPWTPLAESSIFISSDSNSYYVYTLAPFHDQKWRKVVDFSMIPGDTLVFEVIPGSSHNNYAFLASGKRDTVIGNDTLLMLDVSIALEYVNHATITPVYKPYGSFIEGIGHTVDIVPYATREFSTGLSLLYNCKILCFNDADFGLLHFQPQVPDCDRPQSLSMLHDNLVHFILLQNSFYASISLQLKNTAGSLSHVNVYSLDGRLIDIVNYDFSGQSAKIALNVGSGLFIAQLVYTNGFVQSEKLFFY